MATFKVKVATTYQVHGASSPERAKDIALALFKIDLRRTPETLADLDRLTVEVEDTDDEPVVIGDPF